MRALIGRIVRGLGKTFAYVVGYVLAILGLAGAGFFGFLGGEWWGGLMLVPAAFGAVLCASIEDSL